MTSILPLWAAALALLMIVLGTLLVALLRDGSGSGPASHTGMPHLEAPGGEEALRTLFLARQAELRQSLSGEALAQALRELELQLAETLRAEPAANRPLRGWHRTGTAAALSLLLPLSALALYLEVGDPKAAVTAALPQEPPHATEGVDVEAMVERLRLRLAQQPADLEGWMVLARSLEVMERYGDAAQAYRRAIALASGPDDTSLRARLQADLADALGSDQGGELAGDAQVAIDAALALDPDQPKALALAGAAAVRRGDIAQARAHWQRLLGLLEPGSEMAQRVTSDLAGLSAIGGDTAEVPASPKSPPQPAERGATETNAPTSSTVLSRAEAPAVVTGLVKLSPDLAAQVHPDDTLFIIVRDADQPGPPLAAVRVTAKDLPYRFTVTDADAMMPNRLPSKVQRLSVTARLSRAHVALAHSGDPTSAAWSGPVGSGELALAIDRLTP